MPGSESTMSLAAQATARVQKAYKYMQLVSPMDVDLEPGFLATYRDDKDSPSTVQASTASKVTAKKSAEVEDMPEGTFLTNTDDTLDVFEQDDDLLMLRAHVTPEFTNTFSEGIKVYLEGMYHADCFYSSLLSSSAY